MPTLSIANLLPFTLVAIVLGYALLGPCLAADAPAERKAARDRDGRKRSD